MGQMTSSKPYLFRAIHEWILDNDLTPYVLVSVGFPGVEVPEEYIEDGKIILNISPEAISHLEVDNHWCCFVAKFSGVSKTIRLPMIAIQAIYCQENSQGMFFDDNAEDGLEDDDVYNDSDDGSDDDDFPPNGGGHLTVIK